MKTQAQIQKGKEENLNLIYYLELTNTMHINLVLVPHNKATSKKQNNTFLILEVCVSQVAKKEKEVTGLKQAC